MSERRSVPAAPPTPYKWGLGLVVVLVLSLGWKYPVLGFVVPVVMLSAIVTGLFKGRYFCGHFCPRGCFLDTYMARIGGRRPIPAAMRSVRLRPLVSLAMIGYMVWRIAAAPGDALHWGRVFWEMCLITSLIGIALAVLFRPRAWCALCPIGTLQMALGGSRQRWRIDGEACISCGLCKKSCPLSLPVARDKEQGVIGSRDCLKCGVCAEVCPKKAIHPPAG